MQRGIDFLVTKKPLHLFDRHSIVDCRCGHGPAKLMRMYMIDVGLFTHLSEHHLHTAGKKAIMRMPDGNKQRRVFICPGVQVFLQMELGFQTSFRPRLVFVFMLLLPSRRA